MIENSAGWRYVESADSVADYPTVSEHNAGTFQDLKSQVDGKAPVSHTHSTSQVTGLDAALAGKAPVSHTHSTSQVTGLDAALAGKAPLSTLNTRVPENLALRLDTTVGTRIFAGTTMIFGDTGWRNITSLYAGSDLTFGTGSAINIRRINDIVYFRLTGNISTNSAATTSILLNIPSGFRTITSSARAPISFSTGVASIRVTSANDLLLQGYTSGALLAWSESGTVQFPAQTKWPTALPGA